MSTKSYIHRIRNAAEAVSPTRISQTLAVTIMVAISTSAHAAGWLTFINNGTAIGRALATFFTAIGFAVGLGCFLYGLKLARDKAGDRGEDIGVMRIIWTFGAGAIGVGLGYMALTTLQTMGGAAGDMGAAVVPR